MQFHKGCWVKEKGFELFSPKEVHFYEVKDNTLTTNIGNNLSGYFIKYFVK